jgi:hypothetical protein
MRWVLVLAVALVATVPGEASATSPDPTAPSWQTLVPPVHVEYDFAAGLGAMVWDRDGRLPLRAVASNGGRLDAVEESVSYPVPCLTTPQTCPRVILQSEPAPWLNPDHRDVRWGARVRLDAGRTTDGENIVQKGFSTIGTQYKLQVDHYAGLPSCVLAGRVGSAHHIYLAQWNQSVADGAWHALDCVRRSGGLSLLVDGVERVWLFVPPELSIVNPDPLRLGGNGLGLSNDQFHGRLDDVYVTVG